MIIFNCSCKANLHIYHDNLQLDYCPDLDIDYYLNAIIYHNAQTNIRKRDTKALLHKEENLKKNLKPSSLSSVRKTLQKLTEPVLGKDPIAKWEKDKYECILNLKDPERPINGKSYPASAQQIKDFADHIKELREQKLIRPSNSPHNSPHNSPAFFIYKHAEQKRGKARMVIDYRALNNNLVPDSYKIPDKNVLFTSSRRPDLDLIFQRHRGALGSFLHKIKMLRILIDRITGIQGNPAVSTTAINIFLIDYHSLWEEFNASLPEYVITFQEAITYATQENLVPDPVLPYIRTNGQHVFIPEALLDFIRLAKEEYKIAFRTAIRWKEDYDQHSLPTDPSYEELITGGEIAPTKPPMLMIDIEDFLYYCPIQDWTPEYILLLTQILLKILKNYDTEEVIQLIDPNLYSTCVENRILLSKVIISMNQIKTFHRHFRWSGFAEIYNMTPKEYFINHLDTLIKFQENYKAAFNQGIILLARNTNNSSSSEDKRSKNE